LHARLTFRAGIEKSGGRATIFTFESINFKKMTPTINQFFDREIMPSQDWEKLLLAGWDRVGDHFFHRQFDHYIYLYTNGVRFSKSEELMPLRYRLDENFAFSKSQRNNIRQNSDLTRIYQPAKITDEKLKLFDAWYLERFQKTENLETWASDNQKPLPIYECSLFSLDKLIACSFFDITKNCQYSLTAFYDPNEMKRSLGTFTLLCEIENGLANGKKFHFPGHAYLENAMYDYKKRIPNAERFDWATGKWVASERKF
jgi:arginyl-tRNA--protein-N-Asp/Glu arginylyltransferase